MPELVRRKGKCDCEVGLGLSVRRTCVSCSQLSLKLLRIVLDIPEGVWYKVTLLGGDSGLEVWTMRQLEMDFGSRSDSLEV